MGLPALNLELFPKRVQEDRLRFKEMIKNGIKKDSLNLINNFNNDNQP